MRTFIEAERGASCRLGRYSNLLTFLQSVFSLEVYSWVLCASPNENYKTYHLCRNEVAYSILYQVGLLLKDSTLRAFPLAPVLRAANHRRMASAVPDDRTYNRTSPVVPGRTRDVLQCPGRSFFSRITGMAERISRFIVPFSFRPLWYCYGLCISSW